MEGKGWEEIWEHWVPEPGSTTESTCDALKPKIPKQNVMNEGCKGCVGDEEPGDVQEKCLWTCHIVSSLVGEL